MARQPLDAPETFARLVARAIRREMGDRRMSDSALARRLGKSNKYTAARLDETFEFSLNDVENFCLYIGVNPEDWIGGIVRDRENELAARTLTAPGLTWVGDVGRDDDTAGIDGLSILTRSELEQRDLDRAALKDQETPDGHDARPRP